MISFIFNLPWTMIGLLAALLSLPRRLSIHKKPFAIVVHVYSLWWYWWLPGKRYVRAITWGHFIMLSPAMHEKDLAHELIHVKQHSQYPLIFPLLYLIEMIQRGSGIKNKHEEEAYRIAGNPYII